MRRFFVGAGLALALLALACGKPPPMHVESAHLEYEHGHHNITFDVHVLGTFVNDDPTRTLSPTKLHVKLRRNPGDTHLEEWDVPVSGYTVPPKGKTDFDITLKNGISTYDGVFVDVTRADG